jgi:beta-galactosidase
LGDGTDGRCAAPEQRLSLISRRSSGSLGPRALAVAVGLPLLSTVLLGACQAETFQPSQLPTTLEFVSVDRGRVAMQDGIPVPTFTYQPDRPRLDLAGRWRFQPVPLDQRLTFEPRSRSLAALTSLARGRQTPGYDDHGWATLPVPGSFSLPPSGSVQAGWYRTAFTVPMDWAGRAVTLKFASVDYLADVWLNGHYLGYHEGGFTPFAFPVERQLHPGRRNVLAVRVASPAPGTRLDIVPWGLLDWWRYGGITGPVWLEATNPLSLVRADVTPHLDGANVAIVLQNRGGSAVTEARVEVQVLPASVNETNLLNPSPAALIPPEATAIVDESVNGLQIGARGVVRRDLSFTIANPDLWSPDRPALYVLRAVIDVGGTLVDTLYQPFGLRRIEVDPSSPRLLLNGLPVTFDGVAIHNERVWPPRPDGAPGGGPRPSAEDWLGVLGQARQVHADLLRVGHAPADPTLLMLADRTGFAVWEEIPLTHNTPETLSLVMGRGLPQQMLAEMDLRDFDHPSVLFHGFANESTGVGERLEAMRTLHDLDHRVDGTRLDGQAMYGSNPTDPTSEPLDVAGYTFYYGVFYGGTAITAETERALAEAHSTYPAKPLMVLEFGRWADSPAEEPAQAQVFQETYAGIASRRDDLAGGYVGSAVWWTLDDYWTDRPGIGVEHFGLFRPDGSPRQVASLAAAAFGAVSAGAGAGAEQGIVSGGRGEALPQPDPFRLVGYIAYGLGIGCWAGLALTVVLLTLRRRRDQDRGSDRA